MGPLELFGLYLLLLYPLFSSYEVLAFPSSDDGIGDIPAYILKLLVSPGVQITQFNVSSTVSAAKNILDNFHY